MNEDFQKIYEYVSNQKAELLKMYNFLEKEEFNKLTLIDKFANNLDLVINKELYFALISRLVSLKEEPFLVYLKENSFDEGKVLSLQNKAYMFVKEFWHTNHLNLFNFIKTTHLLTPFYREIIKGVYNIGTTFSIWQVKWKEHIIDDINKELTGTFKSTSEILEYLRENNLFDLGHNEEIADRSYSVLVRNEDGYKSTPYISAFKKEVTDIIDEMELLLEKLIELEDDEYNSKWEWIAYFQALVLALGEDRKDSLVFTWSKVDEAWMKIKTPLQVAHPLEYYEDHLRKAVALEWDLRLNKQDISDEYDIKDDILKMYDEIYSSLDTKNDVYQFSLKALENTQMYISRPIMFFGAELNGMFSAQVVPNDEVVSSKMGKKIFAYIDEIYEESLSKPKMKLDTLVFEKSFLDDLQALKKDKKRWYKTYITSTIGHEFGHILWVDEKSESVMNENGNFKNIEEFKATTGGLVSFFVNTDEELKKSMLLELIARSVKLMGYKKVKEVEPYYVEGLIHLNLLYKSGVIKFEDKLVVDFSEKCYKELKKNYIATYKNLAKHYLSKKGASEFLSDFVSLNEEFFMPLDDDIKCFVEEYYILYEKYATEIL